MKLDLMRWLISITQLFSSRSLYIPLICLMVVTVQHFYSTLPLIDAIESRIRGGISSRDCVNITVLSSSSSSSSHLLTIDDDYVPVPSPAHTIWSISEFFDRTFVVNLDRRSDRWFKTKYRLNKAGIHAERVAACDGQNAEFQKEFQQYVKKPMTTLEQTLNKKTYGTAGAWAQQFSARKVILLAKERGYRSFLMVEDDALLHRDIIYEFHQHITNIPTDWKVVYLGATQHSWTPPGSLSWAEGTDLFYHPFRTDGVFGVAFHSSVYDMLLQEIDKRIGPFDSYPVRAVVQKYQKQTFVFQPNIIVADVTSSDTQGGRSQAQFAKKMRWNMTLYDTSAVPIEHTRKPMISVIIVARNAARIIDLTVKSLQHQTYPNLEILVVDDGSQDDTNSIVAKLAKEDLRIKLLTNKNHLGLPASRNAAISLAKGEIIAFQLQNDIALPNRLELQSIPIIDGRALFSLIKVGYGFVPSKNIREYILGDQVDYRKLVGSSNFESFFDISRSLFDSIIFNDIGLFEKFPTGARISEFEFLERLLAQATGITLSGPELLHEYLKDIPYVLHTYEHTDSTLVYNFAPNEKPVGLFNEKWGEERMVHIRNYRQNLRQTIQRPFFLNDASEG